MKKNVISFALELGSTVLIPLLYRIQLRNMIKKHENYLLGNHKEKLIDCLELGNNCFKLIFEDIQIKVKITPISGNRFQYNYKYGTKLYQGSLIGHLNKHYKVELPKETLNDLIGRTGNYGC